MKLLAIAILACLCSSVLAWYAPAKDGNRVFQPPFQTYQPGTNVPLRGRCRMNSDCRQFMDTKTICYFNSCTRISTDDGDDDDKRRSEFSNQQSKRCRHRSDCSYLSFLNKTLPVECIHGHCSVVHVEPYDDEEKPIAKKSAASNTAVFIGRQFEPGHDVPLRGRCRMNSDCRQFMDTKTICYFNSCTRISTDDGDDDDDKKLSRRPKRDVTNFVRAYGPGTNVRLRGRCRKNTDCLQREGSTTICYKKACTRVSYDTADSEEEEKPKTNKKKLLRRGKTPRKHSSKCKKRSDCSYLSFLNKTLPVECIHGRCSVIHVDEFDSGEKEKPADIGMGTKFGCETDKDCAGDDAICHQKECVQIIKKKFPPVRAMPPRGFPCRTQFECDQGFRTGNNIFDENPPPPQPASPPRNTPICTIDSQCKPGQICYNNDCFDQKSYGPPKIKRCYSDADCVNEGGSCYDNHCFAPIPGL